MRSRSAPFLIACALGLVACSPDQVGLGATSVPEATPIRTIPPETTDPNATVAPTAYPTLPAVTAAPPPWTPAGWTAGDVVTFLGLVDRALTELGAEATIYEYFGYLALDTGTRIDLVGLAGQLVGQPEASWGDAVSNFLLVQLRPTSPDDVADFAVAGPLLRVRVGTLDSLGVSPTAVVSQPVIGDLVVAVMIDGDDGPTYVSPDALIGWGKSAAEVIVQAINQTIDQTLTTTTAPGTTDPLTSLVGVPFASSRVLDPTSVVASIPANGLVLAIPTTDTFLALAVDAALDLDTLTNLALQTRDDHDAGASPASPDLYWWRDGALQVLTLQGDELVVPPELQALLSA